MYKNIICFFSFTFISWNIQNSGMRERVEDGWNGHSGRDTNLQWTASSLFCFRETGTGPPQGTGSSEFLFDSLLPWIWYSSYFSLSLKPGQSGARPSESSQKQDHRAKKHQSNNITQLKDVQTKQSFVEALDERLDTIFLNEQDVEAAWIILRDTVYSTVMECLGSSTKRHRNWFDAYHAEIMYIIGKKCAAHLEHLHDPRGTVRSIRSTD